MVTETITWHPVAEQLPDVDTNVLLALHDATTCEGFLDDDGEGNALWRDVTASPLNASTVTHWADLPKGPNAC